MPKVEGELTRVRKAKGASQAEPFVRAEKIKNKRGPDPCGSHLNNSGGGANGSTSKQPIRFKQTLTTEFTNFNRRY